MNFYELFFIFLQFLLVALSSAVIFVIFLIARSKTDKSLINVDEKGLLSEKKIREIARQNFNKANDSDIETWLHDAITAWFDSYEVSSFAPFQHFFPDTQNTAKSFARILQVLPNEKSSRKTYSIHSQFRNDAVHQKQFEGLQSELSSLITDDKAYYEGVEKLIYTPLECLVNVSRVESFIKSYAPSRESEKAKESTHIVEPSRIRANVSVHAKFIYILYLRNCYAKFKN